MITNVVHGIVNEMRGVLAADNEADYLTDFTASFQFAQSVDAIGADCDDG